jgi:Divergent InlB B-repeat domain
MIRWCLLLLAFASFAARADVVYAQPHNGAGTVHKSSWYAPDGLDGDEYAWDSFTLASGAAISEIRWRGGYAYSIYGFARSPVTSFTISIYRSIAAGSQPDLGTGGRLARYTVNSNAGETAAGIFGGVSMYDYAYTLPAAFQAAAGTKYWVQIEASQGLAPSTGWPPDWGLATGAGGNNAYFRFIVGGTYQAITSDLAFSIVTSAAPTVTISASASPAGAGVISGAGSYPINSSAQLVATANPGWGFSRWTEGSSQVSTNAGYTFATTASRTLVANFVPAYTVSAAAFPIYAGAASGGGTFNSGASVTVSATPKAGYDFAYWADWGTPVSTDATYTFAAGADRSLQAVFVNEPRGTTFTLDDGPSHTSFPISLASDGLGMLLTATGSGYSLQPVGTVGISPAGFEGLLAYPNSVFAADLIAEFTEPLTFFSIMYSPQELGCDTSATMRATAYRGGVQVGTATTTAPVPGTYPTGTLAITIPDGFDRVVVHYDARPATCQDWGPIFLADTITVVRACVATSILTQPLDTTGCPSLPTSFQVVPAGSGPFAYAWRHEGVEIDPNVNATAATDTLTITQPSLADGGRYDCVVTGACSQATTAAATIVVCIGDFNCDGGVDGADIEAFFTAWEAGSPESDVNQDGGIDGADVEAFFTHWQSGC